MKETPKKKTAAAIEQATNWFAKKEPDGSVYLVASFSRHSIAKKAAYHLSRNNLLDDNTYIKHFSLPGDFGDNDRYEFIITNVPGFLNFTKERYPVVHDNITAELNARYPEFLEPAGLFPQTRWGIDINEETQHPRLHVTGTTNVINRVQERLQNLEMRISARGESDKQTTIYIEDAQSVAELLNLIQKNDSRLYSQIEQKAETNGYEKLSRLFDLDGQKSALWTERTDKPPTEHQGRLF